MYNDPKFEPRPKRLIVGLFQLHLGLAVLVVKLLALTTRDPKVLSSNPESFSENLLVLNCSVLANSEKEFEKILL